MDGLGSEEIPSAVPSRFYLTARALPMVLEVSYKSIETLWRVSIEHELYDDPVFSATPACREVFKCAEASYALLERNTSGKTRAELRKEEMTLFLFRKLTCGG